MIGADVSLLYLNLRLVLSRPKPRSSSGPDSGFPLSGLPLYRFNLHSFVMSAVPSLTSLLPEKSYLVAYSVPLLLISLILAFAGAFLTLDRTRKFRPRYDALPGNYVLENDVRSFGRVKVIFDWFANLEGGLGGLMLGYAFGVHLSTFLSLLVQAASPSVSPLSPVSFIPTYLLSGLFTLVLAGRYSILALLFSSISGAFTFALGVSIIIHPNLRTRVVLVSVIVTLLSVAVGCCSFIPALRSFKHPLIRFSTSAVGAFGVTMSISLLSSTASSWSSPYSHLYLDTSPVTAPSSLEWGTPAEKGFSVLFCVLLLLGTTCDWALWKKFGECPDEKWDTYLAEYADNLPNDKNRAGSFQPLTSAWDRLFGRGESVGAKANFWRNKAVLPLAEVKMTSGLDIDIKYPQSSPGLTRTGYPHKLRRYDSNFSPTSTLTAVNDEPLSMYKSAPGLLKKGGRRSTGGKSVSTASLRGNGFQRKEVVKFRPLDTGEFSESDDDDLDYEKEMGKLKAMRRRTKDGTISRPLTPASSDKQGDGPPDYSDFESDVERGKPVVREQDIASSFPSFPTPSRTEEWTPEFLRRHRTSHSLSHSQSVPSISGAQNLPAPVPLPASPSLLVALDRIERARREVYDQSHPRLGHPGTDAVTGATATQGDTAGIREEGRGQRWEEFWQEVQVKGQYQGPESVGVGRR
ncbi:hypothetical protein D9757_008905 [Collybiopsis confluens]|uniref:DUF4203 domain-containing protein n=1 Tax=Collybiopsis confluens TaxID=2823264 RepID=A0A8H5M0I3_9AGAR|nr:hypothetical protein D9757_008905 [Collybiopsis confluens]